ncbi:Peroxisome membrane protein, Pex16 [Sesbania bispinosa]|nr:Peroxisome membrane protein, Pex16 [Sesbania bispinosa]
MEVYKRWVRQNKEYVHSLESLANGLTWLLPERFSDSEIGPEAVEVVAQHYFGDDKKWNFLAVTEATKVLVRLSLFRKSGYKMLLSGGETNNDETDTNKIGLNPGGNHGSNYMKNNHGPNPWNMEGRALSALSKFGENARMVSEPMWLHKVQQQQAIMKPPVVERPTLFSILSKKGLRGALFLIGEVLFISRPLIYVLFIRKYGIRSWTPWFLSLAIDCIGMSILSLVTTSVAGGKEQMLHLSDQEKDEVKRRKLLFVLYLMRDPFFSKYTRHRLESAEKVLEPVPVIGFLTAKAVELTIGAQTRYTYMSGS